jgi:hypothetical protein
MQFFLETYTPNGISKKKSRFSSQVEVNTPVDKKVVIPIHDFTIEQYSCGVSILARTGLRNIFANFIYTLKGRKIDHAYSRYSDRIDYGKAFIYDAESQWFIPPSYDEFRQGANVNLILGVCYYIDPREFDLIPRAQKVDVLIVLFKVIWRVSTDQLPIHCSDQEEMRL